MTDLKIPFELKINSLEHYQTLLKALSQQERYVRRKLRHDKSEDSLIGLRRQLDALINFKEQLKEYELHVRTA